MGSSAARFVKCFVQFQEGKKKKCSFYPLPKSEEHMWGIHHILPFLLACDNDNLFFPRIPSAGALAKDKERKEKYWDAETWAASLKQKTREWAFSCWGIPLWGVAWSWAEPSNRKGRRRMRQTEGESEPHLFKSLVLPLFCQRSEHLSQRQFHLN